MEGNVNWIVIQVNQGEKWLEMECDKTVLLSLSSPRRFSLPEL